MKIEISNLKREIFLLRGELMNRAEEQETTSQKIVSLLDENNVLRNSRLLLTEQINKFEFTLQMKEDSYNILLSNKNTELYIYSKKDEFLSTKISELFLLLDKIKTTTITNPAQSIETLRKWRESLIFKSESLGAYLRSARHEGLDKEVKFGEEYARKFGEILENLKRDKHVSMKIISEGDSYYIDQIGELEGELGRVRDEIGEKRKEVGEMREEVGKLRREGLEGEGRREGLEREVEEGKRKEEVWRDWGPLLKDEGLMGRLFNI